jgi:hypothetical protein
LENTSEVFFVSAKPTSGVDFQVAGRDDEPDLRRLLRENPMAGAISVSLEREPDAFLAGAVEGDEYRVIVARERASRRAIGMASRSVYSGFFNGELSRIGYLGQLRLDRGWRGRAGLLPRGFRLVQSLRAPEELPFDLTSIVADNAAARRVLAAGAPGMPVYREAGAFLTSIVPIRRRRRAAAGPQSIRPATAEDCGAIAECLRRNRARFQFAPCWTAQDLRSAARSRDLTPGDFVIAERGRALIGCLAVWNQQRFKQIVVRGYCGPMRWQRAGVNALAWLAGRPSLPDPGRPIPHVYISHVAIDDDRPETFGALMATACDQALARGASCAIAGFAESHPFTRLLARDYRPWKYRSVLYTVQWPGADAAAPPDGRLPHHEVALL